MRRAIVALPWLALSVGCGSGFGAVNVDDGGGADATSDSASGADATGDPITDGAPLPDGGGDATAVDAGGNDAEKADGPSCAHPCSLEGGLLCGMTQSCCPYTLCCYPSACGACCMP